jgi:NAD(P)H-dependent FMN reductase
LKEDIRLVLGGFPERIVQPVILDGLPSDAPELRLAEMLDRYGQLRQRRLAGLERRRRAQVEHGKFDIEQLDLAKINLPMYDEPKHPSLQQYEHDHTKQWAARIRAADAFVFVTPEYNSGPPPSLINAVNYVYKEWNYKPAGFVSYGGISGGLRAVQIEKQILTTLKIVPLVEAVVVPLVAQSIADGRFRGSDLHTQAAKVMLDELMRWAVALKPLRA